MPRQVLHRLPCAGLGKGDGLGDLGVDLGLDLGDVAVVDQPVLQQPALEPHDRPLARARSRPLLVAVELRVEHRMGPEPVGVAFEESGRPVSRIAATARRVAASTATTSMPSTASEVDVVGGGLGADVGLDS
jgi:hypothetical protein